jgi:hypothetical protein
MVIKKVYYRHVTNSDTYFLKLRRKYEDQTLTLIAALRKDA